MAIGICHCFSEQIHYVYFMTCEVFFVLRKQVTCFAIKMVFCTTTKVGLVYKRHTYININIKKYIYIYIYICNGVVAARNKNGS